MPNETPYGAVVIGGSAGALDALSSILPKLGADFALPVVVVVHMPSDKESVFPEIFRAKCTMKVREVEDKEPLEKGTIYFAAPDYHLLVEHDHRISLSNEEPVLFSRPSIDVLFETAAEAYGRQLIGVVLSGGNEDGAKGLKQIYESGGLAIIQHPDTAGTRTMPEAAQKFCPNAHLLPPEDIVTRLQKAAHHV